MNDAISWQSAYVKNLNKHKEDEDLIKTFALLFYIAESNAALIVLAGTISTSDFIFEFRFL